MIEVIKKEIQLPVYAIVFLSLGGWLLHQRIYPVSFDPADPKAFVPYITGIVSIVAVPFLLNSARTFVAGYLINGMSVVIGTVAMASLSIAKPPSTLTLHAVLTETKLPDIFLLFPKLFLGQIVMAHYHPHGMGRLFTPLYWTKHFFYLGVIFALGHFIWR